MPLVTVIREELPTIRYYSRKNIYKDVITISTYIHFTKEQREQARRTDLASFLINQGEKIKKSGSEFEWLDGSQKVTIRGHLWYHQYEQKGGDAVDFVRRFYNKDYAETVEMLLNGSRSQITISQPIEKERIPFELPPRNYRMSRVFSYLLLTRGIEKNVLYEFVRRKMIYESADYHNAVFVGYDSSGKPRHAHKRGTVTNNPYKGNVAGSQPEFSFVVPVASLVCVWQVIFDDYGAVNGLLTSLGFNAVEFFNSEFSMVMIIFIYVWKYCGFCVILFTAGLANVPRSLYESARLDGANSFKLVTKVTIPMITPTTFFVFLMELIYSFKIFREVFALFGDYPNTNVYFLQNFINNNYYNLNYPRLSSASIILSVFLIVILLAFFIFERRHSFAE